jgi:hypothetical protein
MDENRAAFSLKAPAATGSGAPWRLPGRGGSFPRVDDHLVEPEVTRDEIIGGRRVVASPAHPPHAKQQTKLDYVLEAHVAPGYTAATDLLTRHAKESDFATDTCIYKDDIDPETGARYLEEIAFEIVAEQTERDAAEKAIVMCRRGVRRIFALFIKGPRRVCEWSPESQSWRSLDRGSSILKVLEARGIAVSETQREEILRCQDLERLDQRLRRAALVSAAAEITSEP